MAVAAVEAAPLAEEDEGLRPRRRGGAGRAPGVPRAARGIPWGPWTLAPVVSGGITIGWGATCAMHCNADGKLGACKRQLTFGSKSPLSETEVRCKLKKWLLMGREIQPGPHARDMHFQVSGLLRELHVPETEAELDHLADSL